MLIVDRFFSDQLTTTCHDSTRISWFSITIEYHIMCMVVAITKVDVEAMIYLLHRIIRHSVNF